MEIQTDILNKIKIRPYLGSDNLDELTRLLNAAYKKLADQGFRYLASHQDSKITKQRIEEGHCFVATLDDRIVGTVTFYSPQQNAGCDWYDQPFVAKYGQFAVEPELQGSGVGSKLIRYVEELAAKENAEEIAIDTAEGASELINYYNRRGYRFIEYAQWQETNYRSVILSKKLKD